jgi:NAD(P)H-hydrate repair Nnr-like enzyme with NAD(P)H-hydrate epimerase domain
MSIDVQQLESVEAIQTEIAHCDAIIDAIFGTGLTRDVTGRTATSSS